MDPMLSKALREFMTGPLNQLIVNLGGQDGDQWEQQLKRFLHKEPCWTNSQVSQVAQPKPMPSVLELVGTVTVAATTNKFVAKEKFIINVEDETKVKISDIGSNFDGWFLWDGGKIEDPIGEQTLCYHKLCKASADGSIITELGGEAKVETTLSEMFSLMEKQKNGEGGILLNNGYANIFYIRDLANILRAVGVVWDDGGWCLDADPFENTGRRCSGNQVFSRNSVLKSLDTSAPAPSSPSATTPAT